MIRKLTLEAPSWNKHEIMRYARIRGANDTYNDLIDACIAEAEAVLSYRVCIPYDLRGYKGFTAKQRLPHSLKRVDGGMGNLIYREDKLRRSQLSYFS